MTWAQRLKHVFNIDITISNQCGGAVKIIANEAIRLRITENVTANATQRRRWQGIILPIGTTDDGNELRAAVTGDMDPGYVSTSKMIERLITHAGLTFALED
jgi:hypothetical protein